MGLTGREGGRRQDLAEVDALLAAAGSEPFHASALCEKLGLPERTLRLVFEEQFGASPMRVLRSRRLCGTRGEHRSAPPGTKVSEVAGRFGFQHLGLFATDCRRLFGKRPSETLRRAVRRVESAPNGLADWAATSRHPG